MGLPTNVLNIYTLLKPYIKIINRFDGGVTELFIFYTGFAQTKSFGYIWLHLWVAHKQGSHLSCRSLNDAHLKSFCTNSKYSDEAHVNREQENFVREQDAALTSYGLQPDNTIWTHTASQRKLTN